MQIFLVFVLRAKVAEAVREVRKLFLRLVGQMPAVHVLHYAVEVRLDRVRPEFERFDIFLVLSERAE